MKNTLLNFDKIDGGDFIANDYTSRNFKQILDLPELSDSKWVEYIELYDNQTIEQISFLVYDNTNFWDILLIINNIDPLFDMSYDYDILNQISINKVNEYLAGYSGAYKQDTFDRLKSIVLAEETNMNETHRKFKIIKKEKLYDFLNLIKGMKL